MKKFKIEYLIYLFIIISPILDASSHLINVYLPGVSLSPTFILRPIIPLVLLIYIFFKESSLRKKLLLSALIFISYGVIHLLLVKNLFLGISYGTFKEEITYVINYTYNIYLLFILYYFYKKGKLEKLNKYLTIMLIEYLFIIYFSIITKTSFSTYIEGMGYRSYFVSGNSISTILILLFSGLISKVMDKNLKSKILYILLFILLGVYLLFLVGTRTGLLGFVLVLGSYVFLSILLLLIKNKKISKRILMVSFLMFLVIGSLLFVVGSETLERRKHISEEESSVIDVNTMEVGHTTGDTSIIVWQIKNDLIKDGYMTENQKDAYLELYDYANKHDIDSNNNRYQQLIYNYYLVKSQKNILYILFGNGRSVSYGEMILEMELMAILFNFGIVGFILYIMPFIVTIIYLLKRIGLKKLVIEDLMNLVGFGLAICLSFLAGYVFFSSTCVLVISILIVRLIKEENL